MKRYNILFIVLLTLIGFTSCEDVREPVINPGAINGSLTFKLNHPQYANYVLEDANGSADMDALTCVQPDLGFTAAVTYTTQVCASSDFAKGTFVSLPTTVNGEKVGINTKEMDKAMISLFGKVPTPAVQKNVYIRLKALISDATASPLDTVLTVMPMYSNVIMLKITPYEFPLVSYNEVTPVPYFIVGLGDGAWNNSTAGLGKSLIPLGVTAGKKYDLNGNGEFVYTGYFQASRGFKLIKDVGSWSEQWGMKNGVYTHNTGDNINVPSDGYYTITLNSIDNTLTIVPTTTPPAKYNSMGMMGEFNGWSTDISLAATETTNNHTWWAIYTFASDFTTNGGCKFRANGSWDTNWGAVTFPFGIGTPSGPNCQFKAGTYLVSFNDITGNYSFIKK